MSDPRDARKPAPPARPAVSGNRPPAPAAKTVGSPRPPAVGAVRPRMPTNPGVGTPAPAPAPPPAVAAKKVQSEPPVSDSAWETADTVTSMPDTPRVSTLADSAARRPTPPPPPPAAAPPRAPSVPPPAVSTSPSAGGAGLTPQMREEVWAIVRAAVAEATQPMIAAQRELAARLDARPERTGTAIPVQLGGSIAPPASPKRAAQMSVPPGAYGVGIVDPGPKKPDLDLANVGPIDMPNFGGSGRMMPKVIAIVILLVVVGVITMTILSHA